MIFKKRLNGTIDKFINNEFAGNFYPNDDSNPNSIEFQSWLLEGNTAEYSNLENLELAKTAKIAQLKANRNEALGKPFISCQAREWSENGEPQKNEVYFEFSAKSTGVQLTEPNTIIFGAMLGGVIKYSCTIIEGENRREGYVILNQAVTQSVSSHLTDRGTTYVAYANDKEIEINACTTLEELNAININFQ